MIHYVCKYTPVELFRGFGEECAVLEEMPENFEMSDQIAHANLCGFGKSVIQSVLEGKAEELVLVNCCDSMRRVYDIVESTGKCKFLYMLDIPHDDEECEKVKFAASICRLKEAYEEYSGKKVIERIGNGIFKGCAEVDEFHKGIKKNVKREYKRQKRKSSGGEENGY